MEATRPEIVAYSIRIASPRGVPFWRRDKCGNVERHDELPRGQGGQDVRFRFAPPISVLDDVSERELPDPPFNGAPSYMRSVYYYWWAFLREHEGYLRYCDRGTGIGFEELFSAFGDLRDGDFWRWWSAGGYSLFHERDRVVEELNAPPAGVRPTSEILVRISLTADIESIVAELRTVLRPRLRPSRGTSTARYPVASNPFLAPLHQSLTVLRCWRAHPNALNSEVADLAGLMGYSMAEPTDVDIRNAKSMAVSRILKRARQLVEGVGMGVFPAGATPQRSSQGDASTAARASSGEQAPHGRAFEIARSYEGPPDGHITRAIWAKAVTGEALLPRALKEPAFVDQRLALLRDGVGRPPVLKDVDERLRAGYWGGNANFGFDPICQDGCRLIIFCPPEGFSVSAGSAPLFLSLCADTEEADTLYRMLIFQNQIPLHWCFVTSLASAKRGEGRTSTQGMREFVMELTTRLTDVRAIVLVGEDQQVAWSTLDVELPQHIGVWQPALPTASIRNSDPLGWAAIPRQLPARHDLDVQR